MRERCILSLRYTAVAKPGQARRKVDGFLRYVQYRDHHVRVDGNREVKGLLRYVAHRDRAAGQGRLFGPEGPAGDLERKQLGAYIARSVRGLDGEPRPGRPPHRAVYQMVISPERADGLDLRALTRAIMAELELQAGPGGLPPWIAAEHRNTSHPHVHVVMAARREVEPGRFRTLVINRERLAQMKLGLGEELSRQRGGRESERPLRTRERGFRSSPGPRLRSARTHASQRVVGRSLRRLARHYAREVERQAAEWQRQQDRENEMSR